MRVIPVLRLASRRDAESAIECLIEARFRTVELTLTTPGAVERERIEGFKVDCVDATGPVGSGLKLRSAQRFLRTTINTINSTTPLTIMISSIDIHVSPLLSSRVAL